jgi:hypothetical protein
MVPPIQEQPVAQRLTPPRDRRRWVAVAAGAVAVILIGGVVSFVSFSGDEQPNDGGSSAPESTQNGSERPSQAPSGSCDGDSCSSQTVELPLILDFDESLGDVGGIADGRGSGTGFRLVQPSSYGGYHPELLDVAGGVLAITATNGTQIRTRGDSAAPGSSEWFQNSQDNALGVAFNAASAPTTISVTVVDLPEVEPVVLQQAGLWFGSDEDNYLKLTLIKWPPDPSTDGFRVQILRETEATTGTGDEFHTASPVASRGDIRLRLQLDALQLVAIGSYSTDGGKSWTDVGSLDLPSSFFSEASTAGIYVTKRGMPEAAALVFRFDNFEVGF